MSLTNVNRKLAEGAVVILDGAIGTELEKRGAEMSGGAWCATATRTSPDILRQIHLDYIEAGADVITANTYATTIASLEGAGEAEAFEPLNRQSVAIAREAREMSGKDGIALAGSMSVARFIEPGTDRIATPDHLDEDLWRSRFAAKAEILADEGVDLIVMEMMRDLDLSVWATQEALKTGLPVWAGIACEKDADGRLVGFGRHSYPFEDIVDTFATLGCDAISVMHSSMNDTSDAMPILFRKWQGTVGVYPESGYFAMPNWQFVDIIEPGDFAARMTGWIDDGALIAGGCCGIGPEHIAALVTSLSERTGAHEPA